MRENKFKTGEKVFYVYLYGDIDTSTGRHKNGEVRVGTIVNSMFYPQSALYHYTVKDDKTSEEREMHELQIFKIDDECSAHKFLKNNTIGVKDNYATIEDKLAVIDIIKNGVKIQHSIKTVGALKHETVLSYTISDANLSKEEKELLYKVIGDQNG